MRAVREARCLDVAIDLFAQFLEAEFKYDGFTYGIAVDARSIESLFGSFIMKERGMSAEWMHQYTSEQLGQRDLTILHVALREGILLQSRVFKATDQGDIPEHFAEVPIRVRDYSKSGFFLALRSRGTIGGMGIHCSTLAPDRHDAQFAKYGHIVVELCRQFHDVVSWERDIVAATGLSDTNLEILRLKAMGLLDKQIIERTGHSHENSVAQHMTRVARILNTQNERQTLIRATNLGLLGSHGFPEHDVKFIEATAERVRDQVGWLPKLV